METVYKKVGRKYIPCGVSDFPHFEQGNWLVVVNGTMTSYMKVGDGADLNRIATIKRLETKLCDVANRKKDPDIMWSRMETAKPIKLTKAQRAANDAFCKAFRVKSTWCNVESLHSSIEKVVSTAINELENNG